MKIGNEYVKVKIGKKEKIFKNLILNNYLDLFAQSFLSSIDKTLYCCFIKFDAKQNIDENSTTMEIDIYDNETTTNIKLNTQATEQAIINTYQFTFDAKRLKNYIGKKIYEIGFGLYDEDAVKLYAYLDVSNYDLKVQDLQDIVITRVDKVETDAIFYSNYANVKEPLHLMLNGKYNKAGDYWYHSHLDSIGYSNTTSSIREIKSKDDFNIIQENGKIIFESGEGKEGLTIPSGAKYIFYRFKIYIAYANEDAVVPANAYYYQYIPNTKFGKLRLNVKYERN